MHLEYMGEGLKMSVLGMLIVFLVLIIIWIVLEGMRKGFEKTPKEKKESTPVAPVTAPPQKAEEVQSTPVTDDCELIAVIAAAVAASMGTSPYNIRIKSYKRITNVSR